MSKDFWHNNFKIKPDTSPGFDLDANDVTKLLKDAAIVGVAATVGYLATHIGDINFGDAAYIAVPCLTVILNMIHKWIKDNGPNGRNNVNIDKYNPRNEIDRGGPDFRPDFTPDISNQFNNRGR